MSQSFKYQSFKYQVGDRVWVRLDFPKGHVRTPAYVRGKHGVISAQQGFFPNPEQLAYGQDGLPEIALYSVRLPLAEVSSGAQAHDLLYLDIFEHWLEPAQA